MIATLVQKRDPANTVFVQNTHLSLHCLHLLPQFCKSLAHLDAKVADSDLRAISSVREGG